MKRLLFIIFIAIFSVFFSATPLFAGQVLGVHILHPAEMEEAATLIKNEYNQDDWSYVTMTLSLEDLAKKDEWQKAFDQAKNYKIKPIVRLVTRFDSEKNAWAVPTRAEIVSYFSFLNSLTWPTENKLLIAFNEVNHASEWGGSLNPGQYAGILSFVADWAHTENNHYLILPAAMDLAANNSGNTREAFAYLNQMLEGEPDVFSKIDFWNSHSYPNPAFSSAPQKTGQNSLSGFAYELDWLKEKTGRELKVFITETGWEENSKTKNKLYNYYSYAAEKIWTDERIVAVTPFVLKGDPGPFSKFTLIKGDNQTTIQYTAVQNAIKIMTKSSQIEVATF